MNALSDIDKVGGVAKDGDDDSLHSVELWQAFLDVAPAAVAILDREMRYLKASARWLKDYRLEGQVLKGRSHYEIFPEISERWREVHRRCLAGAIERSDADPFPRADGRVEWIRWEIRPWHRCSGEIGGIVIFSETITDRVVADEALRLSEARFRALIDQAPDAILVYDVNKERFVDANPSAERLFGCDRAELLRGGPDRFYLPDQPDGMAVAETFRDHNQVAATGKPLSFERHIRNAKGEDLICEVRLTRIPSATGPLVRASMIDITQRKQTEKALQEQEAKYRGLVEQQISGVVTIGDDGAIVYVNPQFAKMVGFEPSDLIGRPLLDIVPAEERKTIAERLSGQLTGAMGMVQATSTVVTRDGRIRDVLINATRSIHDGHPASTAVVLDITDRKRAENALRDSEQKFSTIFQDSPVGIATVSLAEGNKIVDANQAWLDMLGYRRGEVIGRPAADLNFWVDPANRTAMHEEIATDAALWRADLQMRRSDGRIIDAEMTVRRIQIGGKPFAIALGQDITERRRAERSIVRMNRALLTLTSGNEALVRAENEQSLLDEMCRTLVEVGGYKAATVRYAEHDPDKSLHLVAFAGSERKTFEATSLSWADVGVGRGPTGTAIRTGEVQVNQRYADNPGTVLWQKAIAEAGIAANIALPLKAASGVFGALTIYAGVADAFDPEEIELLIQLSNDLAFGIAALRDRAGRARLEHEMQAGMRATIGALSGAVEARDAYTAGHQHRVANLAAAIAGEMGLSATQIEGILIAGQLHDIGKISVPAEFLSKPSRLTKGEFEVVKGHVEAGYEILKDILFPWPIADMVRQHHERLDGSGYPLGLKADAILPESKILAVADVVEAMGTHRPYRPSRGIEAALAEIEAGKGKIFDPAVVEACLRLFHEKGFKLG